MNLKHENKIFLQLRPLLENKAFGNNSSASRPLSEKVLYGHICLGKNIGSINHFENRISESCNKT